MILKNPIILFLLGIYCQSSIAQVAPVYTFLKDDSLLKKSYLEQSLQKKESFLRSTSAYTSDYKRIYDDQFEEISSLWKSSRVVTAAGPHNYLQAIVKKIIDANKELKGLDTRVVFTRDWWPNAYSLGDGSIVINAGLVIFLNDEAELVFVLAHELAHYYLNHSGKAIKKYVETINSAAYQEEVKRLSKSTYRVNQQAEELSKGFLFNSRRHKREHEAEADMMALNFMKKTLYDCDAIRTCLQLLDRVDDSLLYKPLVMTEIFNFDEYRFKQSWIKKETSIFSQMNDDDSRLSPKERDSLKTHPDCQKRIAALSDSLTAYTGKGVRFMVDESKFRQLKKDFFIEIVEECYQENQLSRQLYFSLLLMQSEEYRPVALYETARCLNEIYQRQKDHRLGQSIDKEGKEYADDYNLLLRMLSRWRLDELASLNYFFCKQYAEQMKTFPAFKKEMEKAELLKK